MKITKTEDVRFAPQQRNTHFRRKNKKATQAKAIKTWFFVFVKFHYGKTDISISVFLFNFTFMSMNVIELGFNEAELSAEQKRVVKMLTEIYDLSKKLDGLQISPVKVTGFADLNKTVQEQVKTITQATKVMKDYETEQLTAAKTFTKFTQEIEDNIQSQKDLRTELEKNVSAQKKLNEFKSSVNFGANRQAEVQIEKELVELANRELQIRKQLAEQNASITQPIKGKQISGEEDERALAVEKEVRRQYNEELKKSVQLELAEAGSIKEAKAQISLLTRERDKLNLTTEEGIKRQAELNLKIDEYNAFIKTNVDRQAQQRLNVGNYPNSSFSAAFDVLAQDLNDTRAKAGSASGAELEQLNNRAKLLEQVLGGVSQQFKTVRAETTAFQEAASKLGITLGLTDEKFLEFNAAVGEAKNELNDIKAATKFQASDTKYLDGLIAGAQALAGAYGIAQGAQELFGEGNEDVQKSLQKLMAVMTILQGLQAIQNALQTESALVQTALAVKTGVLAAAQRIYQATMLKSVAATVAFRTALIAATGGLFLLVPLIISAASYMEKYNKSSNDAARAAEALNDVNEKAIDLYAKEKTAIELLVAEAQNEETSKKRKKEIITELNEISPTYFSGIKTEADLTDKLTAATAKYIRAIQLKATIQAATELNTENEKERLKVQLDLIKELDRLERSKGSFGAALAGNNDTQRFQNRLLDEASDKFQEIEKKAKPLVDILKNANAELDALGGDPDGGKGKGDTTKALKTQEDAFKTSLERRIRLLQDFVDNGAVLYKERFETAQNELYAAEIKLSEHLLAQDLKNGRSRVAAVQDNAYRIAEINKRLADNIQKVFEDSKKNLFPEGEIIKPEEVEKAVRSVIDGVKMVNDALKNNLDIATEGGNIFTIAFEQGLFELSEKYREGTISRFQYEKGLSDLTKKYNKESIQFAIEAAETRLQLLDKESDGYKELAKAIARAKAQLSKTSSEGFAGQLQEIYDITIKLTEAFITLGNISFQNQKAQLEEMAAQEEKNYQQETKNIEQSMSSLEEKAQMQTLLDAQHAARQEELARRQREIDNKKAQFDKAVSIMNIILGTAVSVAKAVTPFEKIANAALGAAQLAAAIATQVPHYAEGIIDVKKEHVGLVGEAGAERVERPGYPDFIARKATLVKLPAHSNVIPLDASGMANRAFAAHGGIVIQMGAGTQKDEGWDIAKWQINQMKKMQPRSARVRSGYTFQDAMYIAKNIKHTA